MKNRIKIAFFKTPEPQTPSLTLCLCSSNSFFRYSSFLSEFINSPECLSMLWCPGFSDYVLRYPLVPWLPPAILLVSPSSATVRASTRLSSVRASTCFQVDDAPLTAVSLACFRPDSHARVGETPSLPVSGPLVKHAPFCVDRKPPYPLRSSRLCWQLKVAIHLRSSGNVTELTIMQRM